MNLAVLRVKGPERSLKELRRSLNLVCDAEWKKGDKRIGDRFYDASGFNATVADADNPKQLIESVRIFLSDCKSNNVVFPSLELTAELDIGFTVGDSEQFVGSVEFSVPELLLFCECGISLCVTAYPTSDEANAT